MKKRTTLLTTALTAASLLVAGCNMNPVAPEVEKKWEDTPINNWDDDTPVVPVTPNNPGVKQTAPAFDPDNLIPVGAEYYIKTWTKDDGVKDLGWFPVYSVDGHFQPFNKGSVYVFLPDKGLTVFPGNGEASCLPNFELFSTDPVDGDVSFWASECRQTTSIRQTPRVIPNSGPSIGDL